LTLSALTKTHAFVNGVEIGNGLALNGTLSTPANPPLYLGSSVFAAYFTGSIDEVRVWNFARTQSEIARDMGFRLAGNEPGLVAYYHFDEGTGMAVHDATGRLGDGKILNGATFTPSGVALRCRQEPTRAHTQPTCGCGAPHEKCDDA
jgi:concanavalin A-like lectin/glucanase superfamily protein